MFGGKVPTECVQQLIRLMDFQPEEKIAVCCSGSFKVDRALRGLLPKATIWSNDVSLYSTAIGRLLTHDELKFEFIERFAFMEEALEGASYLRRVAGLLVAYEMSHYGGQTIYAQDHYAYYEEHFTRLVDSAEPKLEHFVSQCPIDAYHARDWRVHARDAIANGMTIVGFPPYFRGCYEKMFETLAANMRWQEPDYEMYDPHELSDIIGWIQGSGVRYCILTDQVLDKYEVSAQYRSGLQWPTYLYASTGKTSFRRFYPVGRAIRYKPVDPMLLKKNSRVEVVEVPAWMTSYIKDIYLAKFIIHTGGSYNLAVLVDGMLVGCIIYAYNNKYLKAALVGEVYLLSNVTITREARLSKLVAKLATSGEVIDMLERFSMMRFNVVSTTAVTPRHVSMKYRGIYELAHRRKSEWGLTAGQNHLRYISEVRRDETIGQMYRWWWRQYGAPHIAEQNKLAQARIAKQEEAA